MSAIPVLEAVTAVLRHRGEILLVRRSPKLTAFPGYWAFPGGKIDPADSHGPARSADWCQGQDARFIQALVRELNEEISFDLDAAAEQGCIRSARLIGTAVTPSYVPRRFDTRFYLIELEQRPEVSLDVGEVVEHQWVKPADFLDAYRAGKLLVASPTLATLKLFEHQQAPPASPVMLEPAESGGLLVGQAIHGLRLIAVRSHTLPPATHTNCFVLGDEDAGQILVDPSPWSDDEMEALLRTIKPFQIAEVFLTHHHPDHCERANLIARRLGVPISSSADTRQRIESARGDFFAGVAHRVVEDGQALTRWMNQAVRALAVPGHDEGQLALMPDNRAWCIVGDLIQGVGTVVIHKPEGHMGRYFASLEKIIALDPAVIVPSHGIPMATVHRLEETLAHRRMREASVLDLYRKSLSREQMLDSIYGDLDPVLKPLALQNIDAHLEKLQEEGRLGAQH